MVVRVIGIETSLSRLEQDIETEINTQLSTAVNAAVRDVRIATPVDTGRAQRSWDLKRNLSKRVGNLTLNSYTVENDTSYIQYLNEGTSAQAPTRFIETTFLREFDEVEVQVYESGAV